MNKTSLPLPLAVVCAFGAALADTARAQVIDFTGARGDFTIFYDTATDAWDVVFRERAVTFATGLTSQADQTRPHAASEDFNYSRLNVVLQQPYSIDLNGTTFLSTALDHSEDYPWNENIVDFGMRPRLRDADNQAIFETFTMTLTDFSGPGEFAMFAPDPTFGFTVVAYHTADNQFAHDWDPWGHTHWHWGFTAPGEYELTFALQGQFPNETLSGIGSTTVHFQVIPEPATIALLLGLGLAGFVLRRRTRGTRVTN